MQATLEPENNPPRVYINIAGLPETVAAISVARTITAGYSSVPYEVMYVRGNQRGLVGTTAYLMDWDIPAGVPVTYTITATDASGATVDTHTTNPVTITGPGGSVAWLSDPLAPAEAVTATLLADSDSEREYPSSVQVIIPAGTHYGVTTAGTRQAPIMHLEVCTRGDEIDALEKLIIESPTLLVRPPVNTRMPAMFYGSPDKVTRTNVGSRAGLDGMHVHWSWDMQQTRGPGRDLLISVNPYQDEPTTPTPTPATPETYRESLATWPTYRVRVRGENY